MIESAPQLPEQRETLDGDALNHALAAMRTVLDGPSQGSVAHATSCSPHRPGVTSSRARGMAARSPSICIWHMLRRICAPHCR